MMIVAPPWPLRGSADPVLIALSQPAAEKDTLCVRRLVQSTIAPGLLAALAFHAHGKAKADRLGDMGVADVLRPGQIGDSAGNPENPVIAPRG